MTQVLIDRATLEQAIDELEKFNFDKLLVMTKLRATLVNAKRVELDASTIGELEHAINIVKQKSAVAV